MSMKKTIITIFIILFFYSCLTKNEIKYPFIFIESKTEIDNNFENKMDLYVVPENLNIDTLKMFCKEKKERFNNRGFYYIVFFDLPENATFPHNPLTSFFGIEEKPLSHIKAYYEFNNINDYSRLNLYQKNAYEGEVTQIEL